MKLTNFANIDQVAAEVGKFDFVLADLGVSSMQIDNPDRGFTYKAEGPLDLRMNPMEGISASDRLLGISKEELIGMLVENSDEPYAEEIAEKILQRNRKSKAGWTTTELHEVIESALVRIPEKERKEAVKKASAVRFRRCRIDVNHEFEALYALMEKAAVRTETKRQSRNPHVPFRRRPTREKDLPAVLPGRRLSGYCQRCDPSVTGGVHPKQPGALDEAALGDPGRRITWHRCYKKTL